MNQGPAQQKPSTLPPSKVDAIKKVHAQLVDTLDRIKVRLQSPSVEPDKVPLLLSKQTEFTNQLNILHDKFKDIVGPYQTQQTITATRPPSTPRPRPSQTPTIATPQPITQPSRTPPTTSHNRPQIPGQTTPVQSRPIPHPSQNIYYVPHPPSVGRPQPTHPPHYQPTIGPMQAQKTPIPIMQPLDQQHMHQPSHIPGGFSAIQQLVPSKQQYQQQPTYPTPTSVPSSNAPFLRFPPQVQPSMTTFRHPPVATPIHPQSYPPGTPIGNYFPQGTIAPRPQMTSAMPQNPSQQTVPSYQMNPMEVIKPLPTLSPYAPEIYPSKLSSTIHEAFIPEEPQQKTRKSGSKKKSEDRQPRRQSKVISDGKVPRTTTPVLKSASITKGIGVARKDGMINITSTIQGAIPSNIGSLTSKSQQSKGLDSIVSIDHSRVLTSVQKPLIQIQGKNIQTLIRQVCPFISSDNCLELERAVSIVAEQFIDIASTLLCQLAILHVSPHIRLDDVHYVLEHQFGINLPFSSTSMEDRILSLSKSKANTATHQHMVSLLGDTRKNMRSRRRIPQFPRDAFCTLNYSEATLLNRMKKALRLSRSNKMSRLKVKKSDTMDHPLNAAHESSDIEEDIHIHDGATIIDQLDQVGFIVPKDETHLLIDEDVSRLSESPNH